MWHKLHWSQILKEGKVDTAYTAVFLFAYICVLNLLDYCSSQLGPGQGEQLLDNGRDSGGALQTSIAEVTSLEHCREDCVKGVCNYQTHTSLTVYSQAITQKEPYSDPVTGGTPQSTQLFEVIYAILRHYYNVIFNSKCPKEWGLYCNLSEQCFHNRELKSTVCAECPGV